MTQSCTPWYPTIFPEKCDGCAPFGKPKCLEFCPNDVFEFRDGKAIVAHLKCVNGCTACEPLCYKKEIIFPKKSLHSHRLNLQTSAYSAKPHAKSAAKPSGLIGKLTFA